MMHEGNKGQAKASEHSKETYRFLVQQTPSRVMADPTQRFPVLLSRSRITIRQPSRLHTQVAH
jgi:hypothetical protein